MSYTKHEFESGEKLYAAELNEMDEQIYRNTEAIANLDIPTVDDILNELPTWQGGAY